MDEIVLRGMARWPDVPDVYGWLALDRRGNWLVKGADGGFGRIANAALCDFIGRNYQPDAGGRWFFQNGPQRVFVKLHYMPLVYRLEAGGAQLRAHDGRIAQTLRAAWLDDSGGLLVQTDAGAGALDDRDLAEALGLMRDAGGSSPDEVTLLRAIGKGAGLRLRLLSREVPLGGIAGGDAAAFFGFVAEPRPPAGQADC
jgi:hypothetical protein